MEEQNYVLKYRKKYPRCEYCRFKKHVIPWALGGQYSYNKCVLKDVPLKEWYFLFWRWQGRFCRWFKPKEDDIDI